MIPPLSSEIACQITISATCSRFTYVHVDGWQSTHIKRAGREMYTRLHSAGSLEQTVLIHSADNAVEKMIWVMVVHLRKHQAPSAAREAGGPSAPKAVAKTQNCSCTSKLQELKYQVPKKQSKHSAVARKMSTTQQ